MSEKQDASEKLLEQAAGAIGEASDAVKKLAPHAWEIMVRQQVVEGVVYGIGCSVMAIVCLVAAYRLFKRVAKEGVMEDSMGPFPMLAASIATLGFFVFACQIPQGVMQAANPEYYAIKMLVKG